jgi:hypothetical protein
MPVDKKRGGSSDHTTGPLPLLFDLEIDPDESYGLSGRHPEVARKLADATTQWKEGIRANRAGEKR